MPISGGLQQALDMVVPPTLLAIALGWLRLRSGRFTVRWTCLRMTVCLRNIDLWQAVMLLGMTLHGSRRSRVVVLLMDVLFPLPVEVHVTSVILVKM